MANRYWVGGTGTWNTTSTTNWSASSGGASGASVPTSADSVFFDQAGTYTVTMTGALNCLDITVSAGTVTFATGTTPTLSVAGNWSTIAGTVWNSTGTVTFTATTSKTITSGAITINAPFTFNGSGGTWTLQDNLTLGSTLTTNLAQGTLALGSFTLTTGLFQSNSGSVRNLNFGTGKIVLNSATTSTIWNTYPASNLTTSGSQNVECIGGGTGVTKTIQTSTPAEGQAINFSLLETTGSVTYTFAGGTGLNPFINNLTVNGSNQTITNVTLTLYGNFTYNNTNGNSTFSAGTSTWTFASTSAKTITSNGITLDFPITFNGVGGSWTLQDSMTVGSTRTVTFTNGTLALGSSTLTCGLFSSNNSNTRTINFGTGKFVLNNNATNTIWVTSQTGLTISGTPLVECIGGGTAVTKTINTGSSVTEANAVSFSLLETTGTVTYAFTASNAVKNLTINGLQTLSNIAITIYGAFTHSTVNGTTTFTAGTNAWTFAATSGSYTITNLAATTYDFPWIFGSASSTATWTLAANLTLGATRQLTLTNGTIDFNNKTLSAAGITILTGTPSIANTGAGTFTTTLPITHTSGTLTLGLNLTTTSATGYTFTAGTLALSTFTLTTPVFSSSNTNARTLNFGTGKIVLNGTATATVWTTSTVTNLTVSGTPLVECIGGGTAVTKTINSGTLSEANAISFSLLETTGTVTYAFTASNVVKNLIINGLQTLSNIAITIYGSFTHSIANGTTTFTAGANAWTFAATSGSYTITNLAATTYDFPWIFGSASSTATWTLAANLTLGATRQLTLINGTIDFNSKTLSAAGITIQTGTPNIANTGTASFTTTLPITHTSGSLTLPFNFTTSSATGYNLNAGTLSLGSFTLTTPVFVSSGSGVRTLDFGTGKIVLNQPKTATIWNTGTVSNLTISGTPLVESIGADGTNGTKTINTGALSEANAISFSLLETNGGGTVYTFTAGNTLKNLIINGLQSVSNIAITIYGTFTHQTTNGSTTFTAGANAWTFAATSGSYTITNIAGFTYDFPWTFGSATSTATWTLAANLTLGSTRQLTLANGTFDFNNKTLSSGGITFATGTPTLANTGASSLSITSPITQNCTSVTLTVNLTTTNASGYTLTGGTLILNDYTVTTPLVKSTGSATRSVSFGTIGQITLTGNNATLWDSTTATNFTYTGTPRIYSTYNGATGTRTFTFGTTSGATSTNVFDVSIGSSGTGLVITAGTDTLTLTGSFNNFDMSGLTGTTQTISNQIRTIYGNLTIPATGGTLTAGSGATTLSTTGTQTITTNGRTLSFPITIDNTGTTRLLDALTITIYGVTLTTGIFDLNNFTTSMVTFTSSGTNTRSILFGSTGQITITGNGTTILSMADASNFTYTGTPRIYSTYNGATGIRTFNFGSTAGDTSTNVFDVSIGSSGTGIVITAGTDTLALTGSYNVFNLSNLSQTLSNTARSIYGNFTVPASAGTLNGGVTATTFVTTTTQTITTNGRTIDFPITIDCTIGTAQLAGALTLGSTRTFTLTSGTFDTNNFTTTAQTLSSNNSNIRSILFNTTGQISLVGSGATILDFTTATNFTYTGTPKIYSTYNLGVGTRVFNFGGTAGATATNIFDVSIGTTGNGLVIAAATDSITLTGNYDDIILTGLTQTVTTSVTIVWGNLNVPAAGGTLAAGSNAWTFVSPTTQTITTNGRTIDFPFTIGNGTSSGVTQLAGALTLGSTRTFTLTSGNFDCNNFTATANVFAANGTSTRVLSFSSSGQLTLVGSGGTIINMPTATGFSYTGTPKILSSYAAGTGTRTFALGNAAGYSLGNSFDFNINGSTGIIIAGGTDTITLVGQVTTLDLRNSTNILTNSVRTVYGNFYTSASGGTISAGTNITTLSGYSGSFTIDTANRVIDFPLTIDGNGNYTLANNYICGSSSTVSTRAFTLTTGNLTLSNTVLYTGQVVTNSSNVRSLNFNGTAPSIQLLNSNTTIWNSNTGTNFTWSGNFQVNSTYTSNVGTRTFDFGNIAEAYAPNVKITTGTNGFNIGTANDTVALTGSIGSLDLTGLLATVTNTARTIYGNLLIPSVGGTINTGTVATTFGATSGTNTIDTNARTLQFPLTFNGVGGNWSLSNNLVANATTALTLTNGQVDFNQKTLTFANITVLTGNAGLSNLSTTLNFVHTSGNLTPLSGAINSSTSGTYTIAAGTLSANAPFTTGAFTLTAGNVSANALLTTGAFTHTAGNMSVLSGGSVNTAAYTQNGGNIITNGGDLTVTTLTSNNSTTRSIQLTNGNINVTSTGTVVNMATTTGLTSNGTGNINITSTGNTAITVTPGSLAEANSLNYNFLGGNYALTLTAGSVDRLNFTGFAGTVGNTAMTIYGNLIISSGMTRTAGTAAYTFGSTSTQYITSNGKTFDFPITINGVGGNVLLNDALTVNATTTTTLSNGTLNLNGLTLTTGSVAVGTGTKNITFNGGTLTVTGSGATAFNVSNAAGFTTTKGISGKISMTSSSTKTFVGNGATYNCSLDQSGAGDLTVTGENTFDTLVSSYVNNTGNANIILPVGNTFINTSLSGGVSNTKYFGLKGTDSGNMAILRINNNSNQSVSFMKTSSIMFGSSNFFIDGSTPWKWYFTNSINNSDTLGVVYSANDGATAPLVYYITTGSSFTIPTDWDSANNTVHIWGAGGGGGGGRDVNAGAGNIIGGSGGGGGGYTKKINFAANANSTVSYSIGASGTAGAIKGNGGNGGQTTFAGTYTANGGTGGTSTNTGTTAGIGGTGSTYNGGNGGTGTFTTVSSNNASGGGGGAAAGPNGNGGKGGNALGSQASSANQPGGGGGGYSGGSNGAVGTTSAGGAGGNNFYGNGGATAIGADGTLGGGGAGGLGTIGGGLGSIGIDILNSTGAAAGGGGGGGVSGVSVTPTYFIGSGGAGGGCNDGGTDFPGSAGGTGGIIITYYACLSPVFSSTSSMFLVF